MARRNIELSSDDGMDGLTIDDIISQITAQPVNQPVAQPVVSTVQQQPLFADLIKAYNKKGATTSRSEETEQGTQTYEDQIDLGNGWMAWQKPAEIIGYEGEGEDARPIMGEAELGGFSRKEGDKVNFYNLDGDVVSSQKWNESALKSAWNDLGPVAVAALTAGGAGRIIGNSLLGAGANQVAANALGSAIIGGGSAALSGNDVLKGALLGGAGGALSGYIGGGDIGSLANVDPVELNAASDLASNLADRGMSVSQINDQLVSVGYDPRVITPALEDAVNIITANNPTLQSSVVNPDLTSQQVTAPSDVVQVTAPIVPTTPTINDVINTIIAQQPVVTPVTEPTPSNVITTSPETVEVSTPVIPAYTQSLNDIISSIVQGAVIPTTPATPVQQTVEITAPTQETVPTLNNVISAIAALPAINVVGQTPVTSTSVEPTVIDAVNALIASNVTTPTTLPSVDVTGSTEKQSTGLPNVIITGSTGTTPSSIVNKTESPITGTDTQIPTIVPSTAIDTSFTTKEKTYTMAEIAEMARLGLLGAGLLGLGAAATNNGPTQYDIVPVPAEWKSPVYQKDISPYPALTPIDFGTRDLLRGTQWEKFLDPNYGKIPEQRQFSQPSDMSYSRLMNILGTGRDVMPSQALTINDVISGIQNQYGQTPISSMGQKPA